MLNVTQLLTSEVVDRLDRAFDDTFGLEEMLQPEPLAGYLSSCHDQGSGEYRFPQRVGMTLFSHSQAGLTLRDAKVSGVD